MKTRTTGKDPTLTAKEPAQRSGISFGTGLLSGAAISTLIPWEALEAAAPGVRLACLAGLCASFVTFRLIFAHARVRRATSIAMVSVGGLLMSAGAKLLPGSLAISPVGVGAACFLFGITLLMRERRLPNDRREEVVERLLEHVEPGTEADDELQELRTANSIERLQALQALADTQVAVDRTGLNAGR